MKPFSHQTHKTHCRNDDWSYSLLGVVLRIGGRNQQKINLEYALNMKGQNIGSLTKKIYKEIFDSDIMDIKEQK